MIRFEIYPPEPSAVEFSASAKDVLIRMPLDSTNRGRYYWGSESWTGNPAELRRIATGVGGLITANGGIRPGAGPSEIEEESQAYIENLTEGWGEPAKEIFAEAFVKGALREAFEASRQRSTV